MSRRRLSPIALWVLLLTCPLLARAADGADEARIIAILQSDASPRDKDAACSQLKRIGTKQSVPALAALLADPQLSHSARYALESMPGPEAGAALINALPKTSGSIEIGIINSLAARKEGAAIPALGKLLADSDTGVAVASAEALGRIGGPESLEALESAPPASAPAVDDARTDALLSIANELLTHRSTAAAKKIFQQVYDGAKKENLRMAAFRGLILSSGHRGVDMMAESITGDDSARQSAALQMASKLEGSDVTKILASLLPKTRVPVQIALLQCLAQRRDAAGALPSVTALAHSRNPDVRLAAISALGELGGGSAAFPLAQIAATASGAERTAARQSLLDLRRGPVTATLITGISHTEPKVRLELIRALGNRGDKSALPKLTELAGSNDDSIRAASCQALALLAGPAQIPALLNLVIAAKADDARSEAAEAVRVVYQRVQSQQGRADAGALANAARTAPLEARVSLLAICGGLNDPAARDVLRAAVKDSEAPIREAAIGAECDTRDAELLPDLVQLAREAPEAKFRFMAVGGCVRLATQEESVNLPVDTKLSTFKTILDSPLDDAARRLVLSGLAAIPDPRALDMAVPMLDNSAVRPEACRAVIQIAGAISGAQPDRGGNALKKVLAGEADPATQQAAQSVLQRIQEMASYITAWQVSGPYVQAGKDYAALFDIPFPPEEPKDNSAKWRDLPTGTDPAQLWKMDLLKALGGEQRVAYVRTWIYSPDQLSLRLEAGTDDGVKIWLNGQLVHANNASRGLQPGSDKVDVTLRQGWNPLLLKITQNTLGWEFCVRLAGADGAPISGVRASAVPPG